MKASFLLAAAGSGTRLGFSQPKAFVELAGRSLLLHCLDALAASQIFDSGVVVAPRDWCAEAERQIARLECGLHVAVVAGGMERQHSVHAGLLALPLPREIIVVHDAARPFVSPTLITACVEAAIEHGAAVAALPATDTVKQVDDRGVVRRTLDRRELRLVQTPQAFRKEILLRAHESAVREGALETDDAALVERCGTAVWTVPGDPANLKITTPADLAWARWKIEQEAR